MLHNTLYRFQLGQKTTLLCLGILFIVLSAVWWYAEIVDWKFPMEPPVVLVGGLTTIFAIYWPFKPNHADRRLRRRNFFDYKTNNGDFDIGREETEFTLHFTSASGSKIHFYNYSPDVKSVAIAQGAGQISDIKDVSAFDYSSNVITPLEGQIVCLENQHGNFACVHGCTSNCVAERLVDTARKTLGALVGDLLGSHVVTNEIGVPVEATTSCPEDVTSIGMRMHLNLTDADFAQTKNELNELVLLRNNLVHHFIDEHDLWSLDGCRGAHDALVAAYSRIDQHFEQLRGWAEHMEQQRRRLAEFVQSEVFHDLVVNGIARMAP